MSSSDANNDASFAPHRKTMVVFAVPITASCRKSGTCDMNWWATTRLRRYLRASERICAKAVKFIDHQREVAPLLLRHGGPPVGRLCESGRQQGPEQRTALIPHPPLAEVHYQHLSGVHDPVGVELALAAEDVAHGWVGDQSADLVLKGGDVLSSLPVIPAGKLVLPKCANGRVLALSE